jgi:tetratricopeptide (TPR) repeat protein
MKLTRSQLIVLIILGATTVWAYVCLASIAATNSQQLSHVLAPVTPTLPPPTAVHTAALPSSPSPMATSSPAPTPTLTPTPVAPQTRYDLQVAADPENPALRLQRGHAYIALGGYVYAIADFDTAIGLEATLAEAYVGRGEALFYLKAWSAALDDFDRALTLDPNLADAHAWRGRLLTLKGEHTPALAALRQAVTLDETDPQKRLLLAEALLRSGSVEGAQVAYTTALWLKPRSIEGYVGRAMARAEQDDFDAAMADLDSARQIAPYDPVVLNGVARYHAWYQHSNLGEAERLARRAVAGAKGELDQAVYLGTLGWIYCEQGRYGDAVATLEEAAALATVEGEVIYEDIVEYLEEARAAQQ